MNRNQSVIGMINRKLLDQVKPVVESWGLGRHPNPTSYFGRSEHGFRYDFADVTSQFDIKIAAFSLMNRSRPSLWIKELRERKKYSQESDIPIIFDNMKGVFSLTRRWRVFDPFNIRFELIKRGDQSDDEATSKLIDSVLRELPKLRAFLYT